MTKKLQFNGKTVTDAEMMARIIDKLFRKYYNVYGGRRLASWNDSEGYHILMSYTADFISWWMDFSDIYLAGYRKLSRLHWIHEESYYEIERK